MAVRTTSQGVDKRLLDGKPHSTGKTRTPAAEIQETAPFGGRLRSVGGGVGRMVPSLGVPNQLVREIGAGVIALIAALTVWTLATGDTEGRLVSLWSQGLAWVLGSAAFILPMLLALIAYRMVVAGTQAILLPRHYVGGVMFSVAATGMIALANPSDSVGAGGHLGALVASGTRSLLGDVGAGLVLFAAGIVGVLLCTGTDVRTFVHDVRALLPEREEIVEVPPVKIVPVPAEPRMPVRKRAPVVVEDRPVVDAPIIAEEAVTDDPVINRPRGEKPVKAEPVAIEVEDAPPAEVAPAKSGEPLPRPTVAKLALYDGVVLDESMLQSRARIIEETLASFRVEARVREINPGPAVTQFTLEPGHGTKVRRITELSNDLALALAAPSLRIEAPVPGFARVGIEVPNDKVATVGLRETLESPAFRNKNYKLPIPLGRDVNGNYVIHDLTKMPHLLIAGATGSGKSVCLTSIISTFLLHKDPDDLKMLMIDPKMVELTGYNGVPHLQCPVVTEMDKVVSALRLVLKEMERRYTLFSRLGVRNLDGYRMKMADEAGAERLPYLVVIIDELADLMMTSPDDVEGVLCRLAQMGRASGIHLILATQRPSVDVLTGLIKANVPARIAFAVTSLTDSRVVLDLPGAERLLGRGDMLFLPPDAAKPQRIQGAFIDDKDVNYLVHHWHKVTPIPHYAEEWLNLESGHSAASSSGGYVDEYDDDPLWDQAKEIVRQQGTASASMLQRRLRIGYNRAARLIEQMEEEGLIGPADGVRGRQILMDGF